MELTTVEMLLAYHIPTIIPMPLQFCLVIMFLYSIVDTSHVNFFSFIPRPAQPLLLAVQNLPGTFSHMIIYAPAYHFTEINDIIDVLAWHLVLKERLPEITVMIHV